MSHFRIAVLAGGPSPERGISLNSARSLLDHLASETLEIVPIYFDQKRHAYRLSPGQLYSNTPSDFDFRIHELARALTPKQLEAELKKVDLVFPAIHGQFGEDGQLQSILERLGVPFVGSSSAACKRCFDKYDANTFLAEQGFYAPPSLVLKIYKSDHAEQIQEFFTRHHIERAVVKPASGGSSIGVFSVSSPQEALEKAQLLFSKRMDTRVVVEPFAAGIEFTVIILQNRFGLPVALIPTEIEADYEQNQIFDYRKKYLPTRQVTFHCPPRFSDTVIERIRVQAEQLFAVFGMHDFARFDGWVLHNGEIWFADFNPISGMEQNSFLFQQAARVGLSHRAVLSYVVEHACRRYGLQPPAALAEKATEKQPLAVLFGGSTSERQVSLMSGTNVWLKLLRSSTYRPEPYILEPQGTVLRVPYALLLNHTVEEVIDACRRAEIDEVLLRRFEQSAQLRLALEPHCEVQEYFTPERLSLDTFLQRYTFVFLALHGGIGEDGTLQEKFARLGVAFNGSDATASALCMDKLETGRRITALQLEELVSAPKHSLVTREFAALSLRQIEKRWEDITAQLGTQGLVIKPRADGCSSGIVHLTSASELRLYLEYLLSGVPRIPAGRFLGQNDPIEMPTTPPEILLLEPFIATDKIRAVGNELRISDQSGWIEVTVGVLEEQGKLSALPPSLTIAEGEVLSLEEKFQGGTGINITPPPSEALPEAICQKVQRYIERAAQELGIRGYARLDAFVERATGKVMLIEANTLPGLTPSTVLFHQGIAATPALMPLQLLERIVEAGWTARRSTERHAFLTA